MIISALVTLFLIPIITLVLIRLNVNRGYIWFGAAGGGFIACILIILAYPDETSILPILNWGINGIFISSPQLIIDPVSWSISAGLVAITISAIFNDITRFQDVDPYSWVAGLVMTGFGVLAVSSGNPLTLLLAWSALDLTEYLTRLFLIKPGYDFHDLSFQIIIFRVTALIMLFSAIFRSFSSGLILDFLTVDRSVSGYLFFAAIFRLVALSDQSNNERGLLKSHNLGTMITFISIATPLVLLTRVASVGVPSKWEMILTVVSIFFAIFGTYCWLLAANETQFDRFWLFGVSSVIMFGALQAQSYVSLVWGLSLLFSGSLLFLFNQGNRQLLWIPILGICSILPLPFTPAGQSLSLLLQENVILVVIVTICLVLLIFGYYKNMFGRINSSDGSNELARVVYPLGIILLTVIFMLLFWKISSLDINSRWSLAKNWWLGIIVVIGSIGLWIVDYKKIIRPNTRIISQLREIRPLSWLRKFFEDIFFAFSGLFTFIAHLLEGRGGLLWSVLISLFLITIILQI